MDHFARYGMYMVPEGALFDAGSAWLGWDSVAGRAVAHPDMPGLPASVAELTATPRKYGLHGTIKPPFRLAEGTDVAGLDAAARAFCAGRPAVDIPQMAVRALGRFVAIVPTAPSTDLAALAAATVRDLDRFRAAPSAAELAKRRAKGLSPAQDALLLQWGYPYVMDEFRFHITLTGALTAAQIAPVQAALSDHFAPHLAGPIQIGSLALMGEDASGAFHVVHRYTLSG